MDWTVLCICGKPASAHGPGLSDHPYVPPSHFAPIGDTQGRDRTERPGHYTVMQSRIVTVLAPAVGVDPVVVVPGTVRWEIQNLQVQLTTDAVVANRIPHLVITDGQGNNCFNSPTLQNQIAGSTMQYTAGVGVVAAAFDNAVILPLPYPTHLNQGWTIGFKTTGLDGGDQWSKFSLLVKEWLSF